MITRSEEEKAVFAWRAATWSRTHGEPLAAAIRDYCGKRERGQPPVARVFLRDVAGTQAEEIASATLSEIVLGLVAQDGLTAIAAKVARSVAKATGLKPPSQDKAIQVGYVLIGLVADSTGAVAIDVKHGDNPKKVTGGVKVTPSYELRVTDAAFLADAVAFGKVGMPTYSKDPVAPWTSQGSGGVEGQADQGMVHGAADAMRGVGPSQAPGLYAATNAMQAVRFRVNPVTAQAFTQYDAAKAYGWLLARFMAEGMSEDDAKRAAREAARL